MIDGPILRQPPQHVGYVVDDLDRAMAQLRDKFGIGPFFVMKTIEHDHVSSRGEPARLVHTPAFAQWGSCPIELMQIEACEPERVRAGFSGTSPRLHHVAWAVPQAELARVRDDLEFAGLPAFLHAGAAGFDFSFHNGSQLLGHHLEIHLDSAEFRDFFAMIRDASMAWDGTDPVRVLDGSAT
jgi:hypothetical protein